MQAIKALDHVRQHPQVQGNFDRVRCDCHCSVKAFLVHREKKRKSSITMLPVVIGAPVTKPVERNGDSADHGTTLLHRVARADTIAEV